MPAFDYHGDKIRKCSHKLTELRELLYSLELGEHRVECYESIGSIRKILLKLCKEGLDLR